MDQATHSGAKVVIIYVLRVPFMENNIINSTISKGVVELIGWVAKAKVKSSDAITAIKIKK